MHLCLALTEILNRLATFLDTLCNNICEKILLLKVLLINAVSKKCRAIPLKLGDLLLTFLQQY